MITIYNAKETDFKHNGLAVLDKCIRCEVSEELNGLYELELEYPIFDKKSNYLIKDKILKVSTPNCYQLFRIYRPVKNKGVICVYARHIFYDLIDNFIESYRTGGVTGDTALKGILNNTQYPTNFSGSSNINEKADAFYVRKNPVEVILGDNQNSFISRWGGELLRDNFSISILNSIGADKGVTISYGKNLLGLEEDLDSSEVVTRIMPTGLTENDSVIMLEEKYIDSPNLDKYPFPKIRHMHFGDIKVDPEKNITLADVKRMLREKVQELYKVEHIDLPKTNYKVDFVELSKTEEYKIYNCLEKVNLGDIVTVQHKKMGIDIRQKVIKYKWDSILNKYLEIELGSFKENLSTDFNNISNLIEEVKESLENSNKQFRSAIEKQDDRIALNVEEIGKAKAQIEITANSIINTVEDKENKLNSKIEQTASSITSTVNNKIKECNSKIEQTSDAIILEVNNEINKFNSKIEQTESSINLSVYNSLKHFNSKIEQNANSISLVVNGGEIDGNALVSAINMSNSKIGMSALNIDLDGYVTFRNLERGETTIDGSSIKAGTIDADEIGSRMSKVSKFIYFNGSQGVNGIGTKNSGRKEGYLWLYSSQGIIFDTDRVYMENGDRIATREWVEEQLEKINK
ncbi:endopeptidase [Clostridium novyi B str. ATCC 27606]|uniref:Endopeptidase n=1 Tax=Clostridium novyi B str. ATCC 27606 TaxID=1443123 RepID=A0AA40IUJ8_CLONO|nr:endopeptidase [Clostridium novyi B str. ATCC 27606]